jgi:hypothetical protein
MIADALQCFGGPMDGAEVDVSRVMNGRLTCGIYPVMEPVVVGPLDTRLFCWSWTDEELPMSTVVYEQDDHGVLRFTGFTE